MAKACAARYDSHEKHSGRLATNRARVAHFAGFAAPTLTVQQRRSGSASIGGTAGRGATEYGGLPVNYALSTLPTDFVPRLVTARKVLRAGLSECACSDQA